MEEKTTRLADVFDDVIRWSIVSAAAFLPLMMSPVNYDAFDLPKAIFLYLLVLIMVSSYIGRSLFAGEIAIKKTALNKPLLAFAIMMTTAVVVSPVPLVSLVGEYARYENLPTLLSYTIIAFMASQFLDTKEWINKLISASFIAFGIITLYGIAQSLGLDILPESMRLFEGRSRSTMGNPVFFGGYIAMMTPLLLHYLLRDERLPFISKPLIMLLLMMGFAGVVFSQTRGAWLAMAVGALVIVFFHRQNLLKAAGNIAAVVIIGFALTLALISIGGQQQAAKQFNEITERVVSAADISQGTAASRIEIWKSSVEMIAVRPLAGYGPDQMYLWSPAFKTLKKAQIEKNTIPDRTHNEFLQVAVNSGFPGLLVFLWIISAVVLMSARSFKSNSGLKGSAIGITAALVGYVAQGLFGVAVIGLTAPAFVMGGIVAAIAAGKDPQRHIIPFKIKRNVEVFTLVAVFASIVAIFAFRPLIADANYLNGVTKAGSGLREQAIAALSQAVSLNPYQAQYRRDLAVALVEKGQLNEDSRLVVNGISVLEEGLRKNPHDIDLILATATAYRVYAALTNDMTIVSQAENYYSLAIRKNPLSTNPRRGMLGLLMPLEKYDEAIEQAVIILQIDPNDADVKLRLAQAYEKTGRAGKARRLYKELLAIYPDRSDLKESLELYERAKAAE